MWPVDEAVRTHEVVQEMMDVPVLRIEEVLAVLAGSGGVGRIGSGPVPEAETETLMMAVDVGGLAEIGRVDTVSADRVNGLLVSDKVAVFNVV